MPEHKGISCELHIDGQKATEYQTTQTGSICSSHVISQEDKLFSFHLNITSSTLGSVPRLDLELWADGEKLDSLTFTETEYVVDDAQILDSTNAVKVVKLKFAKLETVDAKMANLEARQDILQKLGTLEIKIWRAHHGVTQTNSFSYQKQPSMNPIHEKSIKGQEVTHCTKLAHPKTIKNPSSLGYLTRKIDAYETPWVTFIFRHASKSLLEAAEIIPKVPQPARVEAESLSTKVKAAKSSTVEEKPQLSMETSSPLLTAKRRRMEDENEAQSGRLSPQDNMIKRPRYKIRNFRKHLPGDS
ncbi:hypothetical protein TWF718_007889 [Orbilia javanica]|uniref:DUF7918 domain-containing protein n=1 Tax=Orbilia javanica TaxID=47235 RepID=A0AAN8MPL0_9PEZI